MTNIKIEETDKELSSLGGLNIFQAAWTKIQKNIPWTSCIPAVPKSRKKFEDLLFGFAGNAQCLDDMKNLGQDSAFEGVCGSKIQTPKSYGNYLRSFSSHQIDELNKQLALSSFIQRTAINNKQESMVLDFDSTANRQYAEVMEGVCFSGEKKFECLTTMHVFDELGLQYYCNVRPGNTHTSDGISKIIHMIMNQMPKKGSYQAENMILPGLNSPYKKKMKIYARADAGYSNQEFMNACLAKEMGFVVRLRADMLAPQIKNIRTWNKPKVKKKTINRRGGKKEVIEKTIQFYDGRDCEIGSTVYVNKNIPKAVRVVCIRALKPGELGLNEDSYDYFAWATSIGEHELNNEKIIYFYRKRGSAENYIREMKNGFDMHHYPCLKLDANRAYGVIGAFAYNVMRFISLLDSPTKPQFAKAIRSRIITLPCIVVRRAGYVIFRYMTHHHRRVKHWLEKLKITQFGFV